MVGKVVLVGIVVVVGDSDEDVAAVVVGNVVVIGTVVVFGDSNEIRAAGVVGIPVVVGISVVDDINKYNLFIYLCMLKFSGEDSSSSSSSRLLWCSICSIRISKREIEALGDAVLGGFAIVVGVAVADGTAVEVGIDR